MLEISVAVGAVDVPGVADVPGAADVSGFSDVLGPADAGTGVLEMSVAVGTAGDSVITGSCVESVGDGVICSTVTRHCA